jgi:two-component SAPR family response regulator
MHYSERPGHVRVDFFKESGKWSQTMQIDMTDYYNRPLLSEAVAEAIERQLGRKCIPLRIQSSGAFAICLKPYHVNAHPVVLWLK